MQLLDLRLYNFRSFRDETIRLAPATVLAGANNAGKSTIIEALAFLLQRLEVDPTNWSYGSICPRGGAASGPEQAVAVVGRFGQLTESEAAYWAIAVDADGSFRLGSVAVPESAAESEGSWVPDRQGPFVLVDGNRLGGLERHLADFPAAAGQLPRTGDEVGWVSPVGVAEASGRTDYYSLGPTLVVVPGPGVAQPPVHEVLRPLLAALINGPAPADDGPATQLIMQAEEVGQRVAARLGSALKLVRNLNVSVVPRGITFGPSPDDLAASLVRFDVAGVDPATETQAGAPGAGAARSALMTALQLYCDPNLWPTGEQSVILAIEEPEAGLHPSLQREVAATLRDLPARGVQTIITTHAPLFIDAASPDGIRVVRSTPTGGTVFGGGQDAVVSELGARPSDVLLGEHFLVVEGATDVRVLVTWARTLGLDLDRAGVRIVPADGADAVHMVSRLAVVAFPGARYTALFDGDAKGRASARRMAVTMPGIQVISWSRGPIESYFSSRAVGLWASWLRLRNGISGGLEIPEPVTLGVLKAVARAAGLKDYPKVDAGELIAAQMTRDEIDAEVVSVLARVTSRDG